MQVLVYKLACNRAAFWHLFVARKQVRRKSLLCKSTSRAYKFLERVWRDVGPL